MLSGRGRILLVDGDVRRRNVERQAENGLARRVDDVLDARTLRRVEDVVGDADVVVERRDVAQDARSRDRRQVDDRVEPVVLVLHPHDRVDRVAEVGEIDPDETGTTLPRRVQIDDLVPRFREFAHDRAPELSRSSSDSDSHPSSLLTTPFDDTNGR